MRRYFDSPGRECCNAGRCSPRCRTAMFRWAAPEAYSDRDSGRAGLRRIREGPRRTGGELRALSLQCLQIGEEVVHVGISQLGEQIAMCSERLLNLQLDGVKRPGTVPAR